MELFITDNINTYSKSSHQFKAFFEPHQFVSCSFLDNETLENLNLSFNAVEYKASEKMLEKLYTNITDWINQQFRVNKYLATRKNSDRIHTLLYTNYWRYLIEKIALEICTGELCALPQSEKITSLLFCLSDKFELLKMNEDNLLRIPIWYSFYKGKRESVFKKRLKQLYYYGYYNVIGRLKKIRKPSLSSQKHIVLFLYDAPSIQVVVSVFFDIVKQNKEKIFLSIIEVSTAASEKIRASAKSHECENIAVYDFEEFRCPSNTSHRDFYDFMESQNSAHSVFKKYDPLFQIDVLYEWAGNIFRKLKPDASLYLGVLDMGRIVSDVSRYFKKPSINVEYGMFSNDPFFMESNIEFTHRACISSNASKIWRQRKDPSLHHHVIGFCKLDMAEKVKVDRKGFFEKHSLNTSQKTILFASTWTGNNKLYEAEKRIIAKNLSEMCNKNQWNLIIKKHPSETDNIVNDAINKKFSGQVVFENNETDTYELIKLSDFLCTQSSSIVTEALYMDVPFCYVSLAEKFNVNTYSAMANETLIRTFHNFGDFEIFLKDLFDTNYDSFINQMQQLKEKYLFKTDGKASERLFDLIMNCS